MFSKMGSGVSKKGSVGRANQYLLESKKRSSRLELPNVGMIFTMISISLDTNDREKPFQPFS